MMTWLHNLDATTQHLIFTAVKAVAAFSVLMFMVAYTVLVERRVCAFIQDRIGPNRAGPFGLLQPACDAVKAFFKEEMTPAHVRKVFYLLAPAIVMAPAILNLAVIPFGSNLGEQPMVLADLNVGILYVFGIVSLGVYGIVLAGYGANSKYPFLGGIRSGAQLISYEIVMGLSLIPIFLFVGSLSLREIVGYQAGTVAWLPAWLPLPNWLVFQSPMTFLAFCLFLAAAFAETNRTPFDLPEADSEIVAGYHLEYGGMKFAMFMMAEYLSIITMSAIITTMFFGGYQIHFLPTAKLHALAGPFISPFIQIGAFSVKTLFFIWLYIWARWTLPRFRYDQIMKLCYLRLFPIALANIFITAAVMLLIN